MHAPSLYHTTCQVLDADGIAQVTANLASVASVGQTLVNLFITPFLLQVTRCLVFSASTSLLTHLLQPASTLIDFLVPPLLPQRLGVWAALLVTPGAYVLGEAMVMSSQVRQLISTLRASSLVLTPTFIPTVISSVPTSVSDRLHRIHMPVDGFYFPVHHQRQHEADPVQGHPAAPAHRGERASERAPIKSLLAAITTVPSPPYHLSTRTHTLTAPSPLPTPAACSTAA